MLQISALMDTEGNGKRLDSYKYFIAGAVTGGVASFVESPIDLVSMLEVFIIADSHCNGISL